MMQPICLDCEARLRNHGEPLRFVKIPDRFSLETVSRIEDQYLF